MLNPAKIKKSLHSCLKNMTIDRKRFIRNPDKDFTRNSKLDIETTAKIILSFEDSCLGSELKNYCRDTISKLIHKNTFVQQREKFSNDAFENLFHDFNSSFPFTKTMYGLRLLAVDGSDVNLPKSHLDKEYFVKKKTTNSDGYHQAHINALYDIMEDRFVDIEIQAKSNLNEQAAFIDLAKKEKQKNVKEYSQLYLADRNYSTVNLIANTIDMKQYFLIRCKDITSNASAFCKMEFPADKEFDVEKNVKVIRSGKKCYRNDPENYICVRNSRVFDLIPKNDSVTTFNMDFRIVAVTIPKGGTEYLVTNLPAKKFPPKKLRHLYKLRWKEETAFHKLKYKCGLNWFHAVKRKFIIQEIYAKLVMYNYTSLMRRTVAVKRDDRLKYEYQISFSNTVKLARMYLIKKISIKLIRTLILMDKQPVRKDRQAPRNVRSQSVNPLNTRV